MKKRVVVRKELFTIQREKRPGKKVLHFSGRQEEVQHSFSSGAGSLLRLDVICMLSSGTLI